MRYGSALPLIEFWMSRLFHPLFDFHFFHCNFNCFFPLPPVTFILLHFYYWMTLECWSIIEFDCIYSAGRSGSVQSVDRPARKRRVIVKISWWQIHSIVCTMHSHMRPFIGNNNWTMWKSACEKQKLRRSKEIDEERRKANSFPQIVALIQLADIIGNFYIFSGWKCVGTSIACIVLWSYNRQPINYKTV